MKIKKFTKDNPLAVGISAFTLIGMIVTGLYTVDARYAKAGDTRQQIGDVKQLYLYSERRAIKQELFQFDIEKSRRRLTNQELQRVNDLQTEFQRVSRQIEIIEKQGGSIR